MKHYVLNKVCLINIIILLDFFPSYLIVLHISSPSEYVEQGSVTVGNEPHGASYARLSTPHITLHPNFRAPSSLKRNFFNRAQKEGWDGCPSFLNDFLVERRKKKLEGSFQPRWHDSLDR